MSAHVCACLCVLLHTHPLVIIVVIHKPRCGQTRIIHPAL